jgi:hypothetical protein
LRHIVSDPSQGHATHVAPSASDPDISVASNLRVVIVEFGRHIDILAEQLGASIVEADRDCVSVGGSFRELAAAKSAIERIHCAEPERSVLQGACGQMGASLHTAVMALQYHDRLAQRLALVRAGLDRLLTLLRDDSGRSYDGWLESLRDVERVNRSERLRLGPDRLDDPTAALPSSDVPPSSIELF